MRLELRRGGRLPPSSELQALTAKTSKALPWERARTSPSSEKAARRGGGLLLLLPAPAGSVPEEGALTAATEPMLQELLKGDSMALG